MEKDAGRITVFGSAITREDQLDVAKMLVKNGYTVSVKKGKAVNNKSVTFINYEREE